MLLYLIIKDYFKKTQTHNAADNTNSVIVSSQSEMSEIQKKQKLNDLAKIKNLGKNYTKKYKKGVEQEDQILSDLGVFHQVTALITKVK